VTFLPSETLHFGDRQAAYADFRQGLAHLVELERLDDRFDLFHSPPLFRREFALPCLPLLGYTSPAAATSERRRAANAAP
jgi:hypothetical protein